MKKFTLYFGLFVFFSAAFAQSTLHEKLDNIQSNASKSNDKIEHIEIVKSDTNRSIAKDTLSKIIQLDSGTKTKKKDTIPFTNERFESAIESAESRIEFSQKKMQELYREIAKIKDKVAAAEERIMRAQEMDDITKDIAKERYAKIEIATYRVDTIENQLTEGTNKIEALELLIIE